MLHVALLTGGGDKPYALGLASSLAQRGVTMDVIGSDELDTPTLRDLPGTRLFNLRGDQDPQAHRFLKVARVLRYYRRLIGYATTSEPRLFHLLWNNKFELFDRTVLLLFYRALGKQLTITVHNVNAGARDGRDGPLNRVSLRIQYTLAHHLFVHTPEMQAQLGVDFGVPSDKVTVIPFGLNATVPITTLDRGEARMRLGLASAAKTILFFGNITPYKGLEHAIAALKRLVRTCPGSRLLIAGRPKRETGYWTRIQHMVARLELQGHVDQHIGFVPDEDVEIYFKAADVLVLPYTSVFQSGVLFLGFNFGLPAVVTDVGGLKNDVVEGVTGFVCRPGDPNSLALAIERYFQSALYEELETTRARIRQFVAERNSWDVVSERTCRVYRRLLEPGRAGRE